jgi:hypothetical protein
MKRERNVTLEVAELIATHRVGEPLRTSEIRTAGRGYGESGCQRFREFSIRSRAMHHKPSHEYIGGGKYRIYGHFKRDMQRYVREHQN